MKMSDGVEWTAHACLLLAMLPPRVGLPASDLAEIHALAPAYMAKHMQALKRAAVVESSRGPGGGYRLARNPNEISLWDIVAAIEGEQSSFRCSEIRQQGPCIGPDSDFRRPCRIHVAFNKAQAAWRSALESVSIADLAEELASKTSPQNSGTLAQWLGQKLGEPFAVSKISRDGWP